MTSVNTNMGSLIAMANMSKQEREMQSAMERLSSGLRINNAADDAAGSAIASKLTAQVKSLGQAIRNGNDAVSLTQTAEGALGEIENILQRMRELAVQAGNSTLNQSDRSQIQAEMDQLAEEINSISSKTNFNKVKLLDGSNDKVTMQIGIDATDALDIALKQTDVEALGIGKTNTSSVGRIVTARMEGFGTTDIAKEDIKINGENFSATDFDLDATTIDGTPTDISAADASNAANERQAKALEVKINENTGAHGVVARAFNEIKAATTSYTAADVIINGTTVKSRATKEDFVDAVNDEVTGINAKIDTDGFVVLSNTDGDQIAFTGGGGLTVLGIANDVYGGFVELTSVDNKPITIQAGNSENGYAGLSGTTGDLDNIGLNEVVNASNGVGVTVRGSSAVSNSQLTGTDGLKINGVLITELDDQTSSNVSAQDKVRQINDKTSEHGVIATAATKIKMTVDLVGATIGNHDKTTIAGVEVDLSGVTTTTTLISTINNAMSGVNDVVASYDQSNGNLILSSASGATIDLDDSDDGTGQGDLFKTATFMDGTTFGFASGAGTGANAARGTISLTAEDGGSIIIEDGVADSNTNTGANEIGFKSQNEKAQTATGLDVGSTVAATNSLASLDDAIDTVSEFRASFGAYENRLEASISNLVTLQVNTDAARSRIEDADFAHETSKLTKAQILSQAATSMLAQANASKQSLLALLQS
jgi:flagellin